ncbi:MAG: hypothetical protein A2Y33_09335 [Spirochaetes bacterium GWF1_51_8]|nr:MAG: hypothetical protein A2Y33_09335 [Spirochaetes bacterium GWF1_51_8]
MTVYDKIVSILKKSDIPYDEIEHAAVVTTDDSARERALQSWTIGAGSKNILFHAKGKFYLVVTTAGKQIKARMFKKEFGTKDIRFATDEEVSANTGCRPGSVPPFGHTSGTIPIYIDREIFTLERFMFNPGDPGRSIRLTPEGLTAALSVLPNPVFTFESGESGIIIKKISN